MSTPFPNGYALLIGVDENSVASWALPDVAKDVAALHKVLADPAQCAYVSDNIRVLSGTEATRSNILDGLAWLKAKLASDESGNATAVVYYSGHGHREAGSYFLVPYDVMANIRVSGLRADDFAAAIDDLKPQRLLVLLDCCFAGGIGAKDIDPLTTITAAPIPASLFLANGKRGATGLRQAVTPTIARGIDDFGALAKGSGRAVMSASQADQKSWIRGDGAMSVFTYHLVEALTGHAGTIRLTADLQGVGVLNAMLHVSVNVPETVRQERQEEQVPDFTFTGQNFPLALVRGGVGVSKSTDLLDPLAVVAAAPEPPPAGVTMLVKNSGRLAQARGKGNVDNVN